MNEIFLIFLTARRKAPDKLIEGTTLHQLPHGHVPLSFSPQFHDSTPPIESIVIPLKWKDIQYLHLFILLHPHTVFPIRRRRATTEGTSWFETHAHTLGNELWKGGGMKGNRRRSLTLQNSTRAVLACLAFNRTCVGPLEPDVSSVSSNMYSQL